MSDVTRDLIIRLCLATNVIDACYWKLDHSSGFSGVESCMMYALNDGKSHSQKEISENWLIPKTSLNSAVKKFEKLGYLKLEKIEGKRREKQISLTEEGKKLADISLKDMYDAETFAMKETLDKYPDLVEALEFFADSFKSKIQDNKEDTSDE